MRKNVLAMLTLSATLVALPLLAQSDNQPAGQTSQPADVSQNSAGPSAPAGTVRVTGTVTQLSDNSIALKIEAAESQPSGGVVLPVGQTKTFALDSMTDKPLDLKVGDHVDLWFKQDSSDHLAARIALASAGSSSATKSDSSGASPSTQSANQASNQETAPSNTTSASSTNASQPSSQPEVGTAAHGKLPKTASDLPLIGIIGLAALCGVLLLRFAVRV